MIPCFENLVGIRTECGEQVASDSGLYVQDLPFINLKLADALISDQDSGVELLESLKSRAINYLAEDARVRMMPYFKQASVLENQIVGYNPIQRTIKPGITDTYKGIQLQVRQSQYLDVFIPSLTLWVDYSGDIDLEVWNLTTGQLLDTITVTTVAGEQLILPEVYKNYQSNGQFLNLYIGYNTTGIDSYQANIYNSILPGPYGGCRTCFNTPSASWNGNRYVWLFSPTIAASAAKVQVNLRSGNDTGGLSITYSLNCNLDKWLCTMRKGYAWALMHRWGVEILTEALISNRLNTLVTLNKDEKKALQVDFEEKYEKGMQNSFRNLRLPNDTCFVCNSHINTGIAIP